MSAGVRAAVRGWLAGYADRRVIEDRDSARAAANLAQAELAAARLDVEQVNLVAARLDADLSKALASGERLQRELRMAEAEVQRLSAELSARPPVPPAESADDGYWKRKWLEDRRNLTVLQDRLLAAERGAEPPGRRTALHVHRPAVIHLSRPPTPRELS